MITKQFCINEIKRLNKEYGKVTVNILKEYGNVSYETIKRLFGSLKQGYAEAGIELKQGQRKMVSKEEIDKEIFRINKEFGYVSKPLIEKYSNYSPKIIQRIYGSFSNMYEELNIQRHSSGRIPNDNELIAECNRIFKEHSFLSYDLIEKFSSISITCFKDRAKKNNWDGINYFRSQVGCDIPKLGWGESLDAKYVINKFSKILNETPIKEKKFDWLLNPITNQQLRIDAYFPNSNVAIEYNGPQHYIIDRLYTTTKEQLEYRQNLDFLKYQLIIEKGIHLIVVHYKDKVTEEYIQNKLST